MQYTCTVLASLLHRSDRPVLGSLLVLLPDFAVTINGSMDTQETASTLITSNHIAGLQDFGIFLVQKNRIQQCHASRRERVTTAKPFPNLVTVPSYATGCVLVEEGCWRQPTVYYFSSPSTHPFCPLRTGWKEKSPSSLRIHSIPASLVSSHSPSLSPASSIL